MSKVLLQAAMDFEHKTDALRIARILNDVMNGVPYIFEIGTPLIKNEGLLHLVPMMRAYVGNSSILVDLKTMDTGAFEVDLAYRAGADGVGIAGVAEQETIASALKEAKNYGMLIEIDSISTEKIPERLDWIAEEIKKYNSDGGNAVLEYHIPIDVQSKTRDFTPVKRIYEEFGIPIAVAGGLNAETIPNVLKYGAQICVVGGGITNPKKGTSKEAIAEIRDVIYSHNCRGGAHNDNYMPNHVASEA